MRLVLRLATAGFLVVSGWVHLRLWGDGYRYVDDVGVLFLVNVGAAVVLAVAVLVRAAPVVLAGVALLSVGSLVAIVLSRTDGGLLGFMERGWSGDARRAVVAEVGALMTSGVLLLQARAVRPAVADVRVARSPG